MKEMLFMHIKMLSGYIKWNLSGSGVRTHLLEGELFSATIWSAMNQSQVRFGHHGWYAAEMGWILYRRNCIWKDSVYGRNRHVLKDQSQVLRGRMMLKIKSTEGVVNLVFWPSGYGSSLYWFKGSDLIRCVLISYCRKQILITCFVNFLSPEQSPSYLDSSKQY